MVIEEKKGLYDAKRPFHAVRAPYFFKIKILLILSTGRRPTFELPNQTEKL